MQQDPKNIITMNNNTVTCIHSAPSPKYMWHYLINSRHPSQGWGRWLCNMSDAGSSPKKQGEERSQWGKQVYKVLMKISVPELVANWIILFLQVLIEQVFPKHLSALGKARVRQWDGHSAMSAGTYQLHSRDRPCLWISTVKQDGPRRSDEEMTHSR